MQHISGQDLSDVWTPKLVGERLVEAIRWARYNAGPTGPAQAKAFNPLYVPSAVEREEEGWGPLLPDDDAPPPRRRYSPQKVSAILDALHWPGRYPVAGNPRNSRILNLWLRCKVYRGNFDKVIEARGEMSRATAYRYRDRALSEIAQGLTRDGVKP